MKIIIAGDYCDKYRVSQKISQNQYDDLFDNVKDLLSKFDYSIVNFEFPIAGNNAKPIRKNGPCLKGQRKSIEALKYAGFNVCTLANNHILDQGYDCCLETKNLLESSNVHTVGVGKDLKDAGQILYLQAGVEKVAVINCCENEFSVATNNKPGAYPLNPIALFYKIKEARNNSNCIIVIIHGGHEHCQLPSPRMQEQYRFLIDAGADCVINHHQHCYSGYELYKSKPIFYGLGNFLFDHRSKRHDIWNSGYMVGLDIKDGLIDFKLYPYKQCNSEPNISLLNDEESTCFWRELNKLNTIIAENLSTTFEDLVVSKSNLYLQIFQPYPDGFVSTLYNKGLLPSFISLRKLKRIYNYINCESHLDWLKIILNKSFYGN